MYKLYVCFNILFFKMEAVRLTTFLSNSIDIYNGHLARSRKIIKHNEKSQNKYSKT